MFSKNTVFVLGAGASWHYGYPTGEELVRKVQEKADIISKTYNSLGWNFRTKGFNPANFPKNYPAEMARELVENCEIISSKIGQANPLVIDDFLGMNDDIQEVGKLLIAMVLRECEKNEQIRPISETNTFTRIADVQGIGKDSVETLTEYPARGDWIRFITHQLTVNCTNPDQLLENPVTFVTFNYDMSLETHLYNALKNYTFFAKDGQSKQFFEERGEKYPQGRFLHIYGQLYPFTTTRNTEKSYNNDFKPANEIDYAFDAAKHIHTIAPDEKGLEKETIAAAKKAISEAEYVYFLGYGFDSRNNKLLELGSSKMPLYNCKYVKFTNYNNQNKINKGLDNIYLSNNKSIIGNNYTEKSHTKYKYKNGFTEVKDYALEKSIKNVYDALAEDFEFPA